MDLEEWELLPDEGFLEIHDDGGKKIYSRKHPSESSSVFQMNYFLCPPNQEQLLPLPFDRESLAEIPIREFKINEPLDATSDQGPVSQVSFKKTKESESHQFVDIKVESPRSNGNRVILPQKAAAADDDDDNNNNDDGDDDDGDDDGEGGVMNLWKRSLTGIGAICSLGFAAAATVCIIVFSSQRKGKNMQKNQKLTTFQIYTTDKRIKQMVHHANKLSEAMTDGLSGIPITRAHITVGGYYDAPL